MKIPAAGTSGRHHFDEGELAFLDGRELDDCPYNADTLAASHWFAGWEYAQAHDDGNDDAYNDPRSGQAADLNRRRY